MIRNDEFIHNARKNYFSIGLFIITIFIVVSYITSIYAVEEIEYFPLRINDIEVLGENLVSKILFTKGDEVFLRVLVEKPLYYFLTSEMADTTDYKLIITVMDNTRTPTFIEVINSSIELGETWTIALSFPLSMESSIGKYHISAIVWEGEGIPLTQNISEEFFYVA